MAAIPDKILTWQMVQPTSKNKETGEVIPGKIQKTEIPVPELERGEVLVEVAGCGVCHTDLGYFYDGVPTVSSPPLTLGHEISGVVVAGDKAWLGKEVIVPAVMPCRRCIFCKTRRGNRCLDQKMPGNSLGIYGGFSSHIPVPSIDLCEVRDRGSLAAGPSCGGGRCDHHPVSGRQAGRPSARRQRGRHRHPAAWASTWFRWPRRWAPARWWRLTSTRKGWR